MSLFFKIKDAFEAADLINDSFHPQFQLLTRARDEENADNLAMRIADPLWNLGRQWQFGRFYGEDNGSPISVTGKYCQKKLTHIEANGVEIPLHEKPLEVEIEAMPITIDLRTRVKLGQRFERLIGGKENKELILSLRQLFPLTLPADNVDQESQRFFDWMKNKVIGGGSLLDAIKVGTFPSEEFEQLANACRELLHWYEDLYDVPENDRTQSWNAKKLLHEFELKSEEDKARLNAPDYQSGNLDWYSFDHAKISYTEAELKDKENQQLSTASIPVNLSFPAMPNSRLFAFEDRRVDLGDMNIEADDLIRIMLINFSLFSGSDWYTIPMEMERGTLCWINEIEVQDVFGVTTTIKNGIHNELEVGPSFSDVDGDNKRTSLDVWDVFKIRNELPEKYNHPEHFLFLSPVLSNRQESEPLEEILLLRDEFANLVWGLEQRVQNALGKSRNGFDLHLELNGIFQDLDLSDRDNDYPKYRLASQIPTNWIPFIPRLNGTLRQASQISNEADQAARDLHPRTYLNKNELTTLFEEAIPQAGLRVQLTNQRVRSSDGKTHIWLGRKVLTGKGEGDSGLRFDYLTK